MSQCASYGAQGVITLVVQDFSDTGGTMWASSPTDNTGTLVDFHQQKSPGGAYRRLDRRNTTLFTVEIGAQGQRRLAILEQVCRRHFRWATG